MALNKPLPAVLLDSFSDDVSRFRIGHPAVQNVDPLRSSIMNQLDALLFRMALQPFSAETDLADLKVCFSKSPCFHFGTSCKNHSFLFLKRYSSSSFLIFSGISLETGQTTAFAKRSVNFARKSISFWSCSMDMTSFRS